jgi:hypothetical protein
MIMKENKGCIRLRTAGAGGNAKVEEGKEKKRKKLVLPAF